MTESVCWLCGSLRITSETIDRSFARVICRTCGAMYVDPRPGREFAIAAYGSERKWSSDSDVYRSAGRRNVFDRLERHLRAFNQGRPGRLLDVGCGDGGFMDFMAGRGWSAQGCDINVDLVAQNRERGLAVSLCSIEDLSTFEGTYEAVTLLNTLGYATDPLNGLRMVASRLRPGGVVGIEDPNPSFHLLAGRLLGSKSARTMTVAPSPPRRLFAFSARAYPFLLSKAGLEPLLVAPSPPRHEGTIPLRILRSVAYGLGNLPAALSGHGALMTPSLLVYGRAKIDPLTED